MNPFKDSSLFEMNRTDPFYVSGSSVSVGEKPGTFSGPLSTKRVVKLSLKVATPTTLSPNSSSIYYLDRKDQQWTLPKPQQILPGVYPQGRSDVVGPYDKFSLSTITWNTVTGSMGVGSGTNGTLMMEDYKAFDPYGKAVMSGSLPMIRQEARSDTYCQSDVLIGRKNPSQEKVFEALNGYYPKSVQRADLYDASESQTFELDIDSPFMIEKAVFEVPFELGASWFQDRTIPFFAAATGCFVDPVLGEQSFPEYNYLDRGGPAITLSLFSQKNYGENKIRDLIMTGVITHSRDRRRNEIRRMGAYTAPGGVTRDRLMLFPAGITNAACVVTSEASGMFTGSIVIPMETSISNGPGAMTYKILYITGSIDQNITGSNPPQPFKLQTVFTPEMYLEYTNKRLSNQKLDVYEITKGTGESMGIVWSNWDVFGRGMTGFQPSGGSVFGMEYTLPPFGTATVNNPWHVQDEDGRQASYAEISQSLATSISPYVSPTPPYYPTTTMASIWEVSDAGTVYSDSKPSPYMIRPGEKLVLAISKTRPVASSSIHKVVGSTATIRRNNARTGKASSTVSYLTGSAIGHDVKLAAGEINITLYGSYVREGKSYTR